MEPIAQVEELTQDYGKWNAERELKNERIASRYLRMLAYNAIKGLSTQAELRSIKERMKHLETCNKFWTTEVYEASHVKVLDRTFLCKDRFCANCQTVKRMVLQNRLLPLMEENRDSLYHMTLTVGNCTGADLYETIRHMARCFKTLVTYLNGNKKVRGIDLTQYDFRGCFRSFEITCNGDSYHPHFEVAAIFGNGGGLKDKRTVSQFSHSRKAGGMRLFSDFELVIQRMWWLLLNKQRLSYHNIVGENTLGRYSCTVDKFQPDDYKTLLNYVTKEGISPRGESAPLMTDENFRTFYHALKNYRQWQGYGLFYHVKSVEGADDYTDQEYQMLERYIQSGEQPESRIEQAGSLAADGQYTILRARHRPHEV